MKATIQIEKEYDLKTIRVEDTDGNIPCRVDDNWCPIIELETGKITNWEQGKTAEIHYKVCDECNYSIDDINGEEVIHRECYVPDFLCPKESGYGDYIIMDIDENGMIKDFNFRIEDTQQDD